MDALLSLKNESEDFAVEFDIIQSIDVKKVTDKRQQKILDNLTSIDELIAVNQEKIDEINSDIDRLINYADGPDYMIAVGSGILAGLLDAFLAEDFSIDNANEIGAKKVESKILKVAQKKGYKGDDLKSAVNFLEEKFPIAADKATNDFGGGKQHHLRDFSHHPTVVGLFFSMMTQFTRKVYGTDVTGVFKITSLKDGDLVLIGKNMPEKIIFGVINWWFHMVSDMAGASGTITKGSTGTGLPGPLVSLLKEMSALPIFKNTNKNGYKEFSVWISKLFNGTLLGERDENGKLIPVKFDLRTEIGIGHLLAQQAIPVIINECIVRGFYFIRRFYKELRDNEINSVERLYRINWYNVLPIKNRTVNRMLTIATGTFMAVDLTDAAINSAIKSGGFTSPAFLSNMILRVNFVGIGRFAIAIATDVGMDIKCKKLQNERIQLLTKQIALVDAKIFYKQADMWISAENARETIENAYNMMKSTTTYFLESMQEMDNDLRKIDSYLPEIKKKNEELFEEMKDIIVWG